ncbi:HET-domain-containing protein [Mytilinidion resinicola]|uniref:HET-domain-containing protein n=1 Tax=Mytilinidion resinicola TaxID=574789 RepID=A0A6A6YPZ2_9PEZI|nr:HET-domain-containing protein [Mytilinidion resinicola]KAF2810966.1 HET-domain-containing protein [Mytilinidion resinicola]
MKTISGETIYADELHKLPHRLLDLGLPLSDVEPRLVDTAGYPDGKWVALSHCWGIPENHPLKTTRDTLNDRMRGIPLSSMPKTFVHAVKVTKAPGLRYLWIDSLCIVQNDENEWLAESQDMGTIYERAVLTLAASSAVDSTLGLFLQRDYSRIHTPSTQLSFLEKDSASGDELLGDYHIGIEWRQEPFMKALDPMDTTLSTRGWATQEWILSRRIVHFMENGMAWVCQSRAEDETRFVIVGRGLGLRDWSNQWGSIIQEHSSRKFTHQTDRLVSLEGLARKFAKLKPASTFYSFGTWESDLPEHLLWSPKMLGKMLTNLPSWSWASCPYELWFRFREVVTGKDCVQFSPACEILGLNKTTGRLSVRAQRIEISRYFAKSFDDEESFTPLRARANHWSGRYIAALDNDPSGWALFDDGRDFIDSTKPVFFLVIAAVFLYVTPTFEIYGLLVVKDLSVKDGYVRVGVGAVSDASWLALHADFPKVDTDII